MFIYIKRGLRAALHQPFPVLVLFLYRFGWGIALYKLCQSVIVPLLHRYPDQPGMEGQARLFLAEGQFVLLKTDISHSWFWLLGILLAVRMLVSPLLSAGLFFSLAHTQYNAGYRFVRGMAELGKSYGILYAIRAVLSLAPLWWLLPRWKGLFLGAGNYQELARSLLPQLGLLAAYSYLIYLLFLYLQFGLVRSVPLLRTLGVMLRSLPLMLAVAALILLGASLCSLAVLTATMAWAGFWMLVVYQAFRFVQTLFSVWGIAAQHEIYETRS